MSTFQKQQTTVFLNSYNTVMIIRFWHIRCFMPFKLLIIKSENPKGIKYLYHNNNNITP